MPLIDEQNQQTARDSLGGLAKVVTNFIALRLLTAPELQGMVQLTYGATFQDGLGGMFVWNPSDTTADNASTVIRPWSVPLVSPGRWNLWVSTGSSGVVVGPGQVVFGAANGSGTGSQALLWDGDALRIRAADAVHYTEIEAAASGALVQSAPDAVTADGDLDVSQLAFSLDETNNAVRVKAKYAGGAVHTGTIPLALPVVVALTDAATILVNAALVNPFVGIFDLTLTGDHLLGNPSNPQFDGQGFILRVKQGPGGSHLLTYDTLYGFGSDVTSPTLSTAAGAIDYLTCRWNATSGLWHVLAVSKGYA